MEGAATRSTTTHRRSFVALGLRTCPRARRLGPSFGSWIHDRIGRDPADFNRRSPSPPSQITPLHMRSSDPASGPRAPDGAQPFTTTECTMSTVIPEPIVVPPHVDHILDEVGRQLQITPTQFARVESAYDAVGKWLRAAGSSLEIYDPHIYPQGSIALRTTVKPLHGEEFDLDLVAELARWTGSALELHAALGERLAENADYKRMMEAKKRCWRLNYTGGFHVDALPARNDLVRPNDNSIEVPDCDAEEWKASNPLDYVTWFERQAHPYYRAMQAKQQAPLPPPDRFDAGDPLRRAVQLMKRHRDVRFDGRPENAPRSIVLTTLAAKYYNGQESVGEALLWILGGIASEIASAGDRPLVVRNPVNLKENFAEAWEDDPQAYAEFCDYVERLAVDLRALISTPLGEQFWKHGGRLFGIDVAKKAVEVYNTTHGAIALTALERIGRGSTAPAKPWAGV